MGINCGTTCSQAANYGTVVTAQRGRHWHRQRVRRMVRRRAASGTALAQTVTAATQVTATFTCSPGTTTIAYSGAITSFVVPTCVTSPTIDAYGASGGNGTTTFPGGLGARIKGTVPAAGGAPRKVLVGGRGLDSLAGNTNQQSSGPGGGGTFVTTSSNSPLMAAGRRRRRRLQPFPNHLAGAGQGRRDYHRRPRRPRQRLRARSQRRWRDHEARTAAAITSEPAAGPGGQQREQLRRFHGALWQPLHAWHVIHQRRSTRPAWDHDLPLTARSVRYGPSRRGLAAVAQPARPAAAVAAIPGLPGTTATSTTLIGSGGRRRRRLLQQRHHANEHRSVLGRQRQSDLHPGNRRAPHHLSGRGRAPHKAKPRGRQPAGFPDRG